MRGQPCVSLPPCELASVVGAIRACPGFQPMRMRHEVVRWFRPEPLPTPEPDGLTCAHLGHQLSRRGFRSACAHPGGLPEGAAPLAELLRRVRSTSGDCRRLRAGVARG